MNLLAIFLSWLLGALVTAYLIGRFTKADRMHWTSELRAIAPSLVIVWPLFWMGVLGYLAVRVVSLMMAITEAFFMVPYKIGDRRRIEWESKTKLLASHEVSQIEDEIKELEKLAKRIREGGE